MHSIGKGSSGGVNFYMNTCHFGLWYARLRWICIQCISLSKIALDGFGEYAIFSNKQQQSDRAQSIHYACTFSSPRTHIHYFSSILIELSIFILIPNMFRLSNSCGENSSRKLHTPNYQRIYPIQWIFHSVQINWYFVSRSAEAFLVNVCMYELVAIIDLASLALMFWGFPSPAPFLCPLPLSPYLFLSLCIAHTETFSCK